MWSFIKKNRQMGKGFYMFLVLMFFLLGNASNVCSQQTKRICDTIPYEFIEEKIVIPVEVNGVKVKYILDTGGQTGTMWKEATEMGVEGTGTSTSIADLNGETALYQEGMLRNVRLSPNYTLSQLKTMVLPEVGMFKSLGVAGILGGDAFAQSVLTFDARKKVVIINYPYRPGGLRIQDGVEMFSGTTHHSIVNVYVGGVEKRMLFDTGAHGFFIISKDDFLEFEEQGVCIQTDSAYGINGIGLQGLTAPVNILKGYAPELSFVGKTFHNVGCITNPNSRSIIGVDLLKYGKVVIDYMRKRFYFFPFDEEVVDMGGAPKTWNVGILPANERFEVTAVWSSLKGKVEFGDEVININGRDLRDFPMSQPEVDKILNGIVDDKAYIVILKDGKGKKVEIARE